MKKNPIFTSERINFIKINYDLIDDYLTMVNDKDIQKYISRQTKHFTYDDEVNWIKNKLESKAFIFSMIEKETNNFIGNIEILDINNHIGKLGIVVTKNMQNNHFGTEALKRFIKYSFDNLNINSIALNVFNFNHRAIKCYENVGFKKEISKTKDNEIYMILQK